MIWNAQGRFATLERYATLWGAEMIFKAFSGCYKQGTLGLAHGRSGTLGGAREYLCLCRRRSGLPLSLAAELLELCSTVVSADGAQEYLCLCQRSFRTVVSAGKAAVHVDLAHSQSL